jgi:hypothetical protein
MFSHQPGACQFVVAKRRFRTGGAGAIFLKVYLTTLEKYFALKKSAEASFCTPFGMI